jgi:hypothetical protein
MTKNRYIVFLILEMGEKMTLLSRSGRAFLPCVVLFWISYGAIGHRIVTGQG